MKTTRRSFVLGTSLGLTALATGCDDPPPASGAFQHGVASGDPRATSVLLWTRVTGVDGPVEVTVEVFADEGLTELVVRDLALADPERDHTVKIVIEELSPATTYHYRFSLPTGVSPTGRTRTLGVAAGESVKLAVVTCSNYASGYFHVYRRIAERRDLHAVIHLGDFIYEYGNGRYGSLRDLDPPYEILTLSDYRRRHAHYRQDPDLVEAMRLHPFITIWDDHEFANNANREGALEHQPDEGDWGTRSRGARHAYFEWLPVRDEPDERLYRCFSPAPFVDLVMLDTRAQGRDPLPVDEADRQREDRRLFDEREERWLDETLAGTSGRFVLLGNQVVFTPAPLLYTWDSWEGYPAQRTRVGQRFASLVGRDVVILTGDFHGSFAFDVALEPEAYDGASQSGAIGVEFVTPALSSPHWVGEQARQAERDFLSAMPYLRYTEQEAKGYILVDVTESRVAVDWYFVADVSRLDGGSERRVKRFEVRPGERRIRDVTS